jgi:hypothetical protein
VKESTNTVILYQADLQVDNAKLISSSKDELNGKIEIDQPNERVKIDFEKTLEVNSLSFREIIRSFFIRKVIINYR